MRLLLLLALTLQAQAPDPWKPLQFLTGEWVGEGSGSPGEGAGACTFEFDLQRKVMIRKNYAVYPTFRHDDLMVVYLDPVSKALKAIYFDNEEHVINYAVEVGPDSVKFLSEQYRLTYRRNGEDKLSLDFDVAPPGKPFANYIHASLRKKGLK
jgi:hypothetical protein